MNKLVACLLVVFFVFSFSAMAEKMVTTGNVNVRCNPDINAEIIGYMAKGKEIDSLDEVDTPDGRTWMEVNYNGRKGFISDKYLERIEDSDVYNTSIKMVTTGSVNVREWADINADVHQVFRGGTVVDVLGFYTSRVDDRIWCQIKVNDGYSDSAYISMKNLEFVDVAPLKLARFMKVKAEANVHQENRMSSQVLRTVHAGEVVEVGYYIPTSDGHIWAAVTNSEAYLLGWLCMK